MSYYHVWIHFYRVSLVAADGKDRNVYDMSRHVLISATGSRLLLQMEMTVNVNDMSYHVLTSATGSRFLPQMEMTVNVYDMSRNVLTSATGSRLSRLLPR